MPPLSEEGRCEHPKLPRDRHWLPPLSEEGRCEHPKLPRDRHWLPPLAAGQSLRRIPHLLPQARPHPIRLTLPTRSLRTSSGQAELRRVEPNIAEDATGALFAPSAGVVIPFEFTIALAENAATNGVEFRCRSEVVERRDLCFLRFPPARCDTWPLRHLAAATPARCGTWPL